VGYSDKYIAVATELLDVGNPTPEQVYEILKSSDSGMIRIN